jgi:hypothetical protein
MYAKKCAVKSTVASNSLSSMDSMVLSVRKNWSLNISATIQSFGFAETEMDNYEKKKQDFFKQTHERAE